MSRSSLAVLVLVVLAAVLIACSTNPATGRRQMIFGSPESDVSMGKQAVPGVIAEFGELEDPALRSWVEQMGRNIASKTERKEYPFTFTVLDSPVVNAFALPGGPTFFTRGLLAYANDEAELAGVIGHEIGHVEARHSAEQQARSTALGGLLVLGSIANRRVAQYAGVLGAGAQLMLLSNSREAEREADMLGVRYTARAGFDPLGVSRYMRVLDRLNKQSQSALPNWLSTHPDPGERAQTTARLAASAPKVQNPRVGREELLRRVDGLVFGDDPREGYQKGRTFHHPQMGFRFDLPEGWKTQNTKQALVAVDSLQQPSSLLQLQAAAAAQGAPRDPEGYAAFLAQKNPEARFAGGTTQIGGYDAWVGQILVPNDQGGSQQLVAAFVSDVGEQGTGRATGGTLLQFLGAGEDRAAIERAIRSFRKETDRDVLAVKPVVLRLETARGGTLADFCAQRRDLGAKCGEIAALNHLDSEQARLEAGRTLKVPVRQSAEYP